MREIKLFIDFMVLGHRMKKMTKRLQDTAARIDELEELMVQHGIVQKPF